ncbi:hypothetical protein SAMN05216524_102344 [Mucilaginibacter sp. OK098]|nr:hypothetical protein SAMN05216524_102344 [Mucilaginibacter sp. OK098]
MLLRAQRGNRELCIYALQVFHRSIRSVKYEIALRWLADRNDKFYKYYYYELN